MKYKVTECIMRHNPNVTHWYVTTENDEDIHIIYRWGRLSVSLYLEDEEREKIIYEKQISTDDDWMESNNWMDPDEMFELTGEILDWGDYKSNNGF